MGLLNSPQLPSRLLWFVGLYASGVGTLGLVAYGVRALLKLFW
jgi:hypothetical protein